MASSAQPIISVRNVYKEYASGESLVRALDGIALEIHEGEFVAIVGTSGSGKSTLMNLLGCLDRPTAGTYRLAGIDAGGRSNDARASIRNRLIGFIFQGFNLLPRTTALENCELPLQYRGIPAVERRRRAMAALESVGLGERVHHTPNQLSGGQQQRVAIARALVTEPQLLLADEPTGNLDTRTSLEVLALLQSLNRDRGITILLVTHEADIAACASRIITFRDGKILSDVRQDTPKDAADELAKLGPPELPNRLARADDDDPVKVQRRRDGGPVPSSVFVVGVFGFLAGAGFGWSYNRWVLEARVLWIPAVLAIVGEVLAASVMAHRSLGRPLTGDQRVRFALGMTLGHALVSAVGAWVVLGLNKPEVIVSFLVAFLAKGSLAVGASVAVFLSATALLRFLLLSLAPSRR